MILARGPAPGEGSGAGVGRREMQDLTPKTAKIVQMRTSSIALALLAAAAVAGCGGSGSPRGSQASQSAGDSTTTSSSAAPATTSSAPTTKTVTATATATATASSSTAAGGSGGAGLAGTPCRAADLALSYLGGQGATGHGELGFALRNTTHAGCSTGGYPGIQFLDQGGGALPTSPTHTTSDFFGSLPLGQVTVRPGHSFSFRLGVSHGAGSGAGCKTAYGLQVIPPNDTATLRVQIPGGASECGPTTVSPVQPGDTAYH